MTKLQEQYLKKFDEAFGNYALLPCGTIEDYKTVKAFLLEAMEASYKQGVRDVIEDIPEMEYRTQRKGLWKTSYYLKQQLTSKFLKFNIDFDKLEKLAGEIKDLTEKGL